jgi:hypothetical protein
MRHPPGATPPLPAKFAIPPVELTIPPVPPLAPPAVPPPPAFVAPPVANAPPVFSAVLRAPSLPLHATTVVASAMNIEGKRTIIFTAGGLLSDRHAHAAETDGVACGRWDNGIAVFGGDVVAAAAAGWLSATRLLERGEACLLRRCYGDGARRATAIPVIDDDAVTVHSARIG